MGWKAKAFMAFLILCLVFSVTMDVRDLFKVLRKPKESSIPDPPKTLFTFRISSPQGTFNGACDFPVSFARDYEEAQRMEVLYLEFKPENCVLFLEGDAWGVKKEAGE